MAAILRDILQGGMEVSLNVPKFHVYCVIFMQDPKVGSKSSKNSPGGAEASDSESDSDHRQQATTQGGDKPPPGSPMTSKPPAALPNWVAGGAGPSPFGGPSASTTSPPPPGDEFDLPPDCPVGTWTGATPEDGDGPADDAKREGAVPSTSASEGTADDSGFPPKTVRTTLTIRRGYTAAGEKTVNEYTKVKNLAEGTFGRVKLYRYAHGQ